MGAEIRVRRVYDSPSPGDGARILVDRVWPRGVRKDAVRLDEWAKDVAPSAELRTWYRHDPAKFDEFRRRYISELAEPGPLGAGHVGGNDDGRADEVDGVAVQAERVGHPVSAQLADGTGAAAQDPR